MACPKELARIMTCTLGHRRGLDRSFHGRAMRVIGGRPVWHCVSCFNCFGTSLRKPAGFLKQLKHETPIIRDCRDQRALLVRGIVVQLTPVFTMEPSA